LSWSSSFRAGTGTCHCSAHIVLAREIGDDRTRFADARALKGLRGSDPPPGPPGDPSRSLTATSRTTDSPLPAGCGRSPPPPTANPPERATAIGENTATATPPPPGTYSTNSSGSSTTASNTARASTKPRHSRRPSTLRHSRPRFSRSDHDRSGALAPGVRRSVILPRPAALAPLAPGVSLSCLTSVPVTAIDRRSYFCGS
jgi:hypothetical protein